MDFNKHKKIKLVNASKIIDSEASKELFIEDGYISLNHPSDSKDFYSIDLTDCIIAPGFVDPQVNGLDDCDFWDINKCSFDSIDRLRLKLASHGTVAFCPTIITNSKEKVLESITHINNYISLRENSPGAKILGIHIEGIFISKYGVHNKTFAHSDLTEELISPFIKENVILFTLAPELDKSGKAIKLLQKNSILVSIGHTNATYSEGIKAVEEYGLKTVTHLFNAMRGFEGFSHRGAGPLNLEILKRKFESEKNIDPDKDGILLALLKNKEVLTMLISDGEHVSKEVISFLKQIKSNNLFSIVSDLVSKEFFEKENQSGNLGGGQVPLDKCVSNLTTWKVSNIEDCLTYASRPISNQLNSAQKLGLGNIKPSIQANLVFWNTKNNTVKGTIIGQQVILNY